MEYRYKKDFPNGFGNVLLPREQFLPLPKYEDEQEWKTVNDEARSLILKHAEEILDKPMPRATASAYMQYYRTGKRDYDQEVDRPMCHALFWLTAAECLERKGRFMDSLIDYIWALCETTSWSLPAHNWQGLEGSWGGPGGTRPLPDIKDQHICLVASITAEYMAWTLYIMRKKLDEVTFLIGERIEYELNRRIIEPFCNRRDDWWVTEVTHNWHMLTTSNCLAVVLLMEPNPAKRAKAAELALRYTEEFYQSYVSDGSSVEGASYWMDAAGAMYYSLKLLRMASGGAINQFDEPKIHKMAAFLYNVHIHKREYYNYSYMARYNRVTQGMEIYDYGKEINDPKMMDMGVYIYHQDRQPLMIADHAYTIFLEILHSHELEQKQPKAPNVGYYYSEAQQLICAREYPGTPDGLFLGAKGYNGHRDSHRDGGSFILYNNSEPVYIELGTVWYNRRVMELPWRHQHFICVPENHCAITVNGQGQMPGAVLGGMTEEKLHSREAAETSTRSSSSDDGIVASLALDMGNVYPEESGVKGCTRTFELDRANHVVRIHQNVECDRESDICLHFITCEKPVLEDAILVGGTRMTYDTALFTAKTEEIDTENDSKLQSSWGDHVYRTTLTAHAKRIDTTVTICAEK